MSPAGDSDEEDEGDEGRALDRGKPVASGVAPAPPPRPRPASRGEAPGALSCGPRGILVPLNGSAAPVCGMCWVDVPTLRLGEGEMCHRACCNPNAQDQPRERSTAFLLPPLMPGLEPTVCFGAPEGLLCEAGLQPCTRLKLYWRLTGVASNAVKAAFRGAGFVRIKSEGYNALWAPSQIPKEEFRKLNRYQKVNHFPGTWELGRKDRCARNVAKMRRRLGAEADIMPRTFLLPGDTEEWNKEAERYFDENLYIIKPVASSRGRGIRMLRKRDDIPKGKEVLIQRYIKDPLLVGGHKFDLRIYVVVTCFDPLKVYVYREGLVRFATEAYSTEGRDLRKRACHLTNYSVNSKNAAFVHNQSVEDDDEGNKWSLSALRRWFQQEGLDWGHVWQQIHQVVVKTLISVEANVNQLVKSYVGDRRTCFEVYGFDIMLDEDLRAWLIEVNTGPALNSPTPIDKHIKFRMVANMLNLVGFEPYDKAKFQKEQEEKRRARLTGIGAQPEKPRRRDINTVEDIDFGSVAPPDLPEVIREAEAELARAGGFERAFPCESPEMNDYYLDMFEAGRYDNLLLCHWQRYLHDFRTKGARPSASRGSSRSGRRPPGRPSSAGNVFLP